MTIKFYKYDREYENYNDIILCFSPINNELSFSEESSIFDTYNDKNKYQTNNYYDINTYFNPRISYRMINSDNKELNDKLKTEIKTEIFNKFSEFLDGVISKMINERNDIIEKYDIKINSYNEKYDELLQDINENILLKHSDCIIIKGIKNIQKYTQQRENKLISYNKKINTFKELSDFSRNYIRTQKLNKIKNES